MPKDFANYVWTEFNYSIPKSGLYQIDLVHPMYQMMQTLLTISILVNMTMESFQSD